jgi:peptidoglycan/LPS O-acetylase OafA/YrhL
MVEVKLAPLPPVCEWDERLVRSERNAFDPVRLILASLVVLEHSYYLIDGNSSRDPLSLLSGGQTDCGHLAVVMFFSLSGFLVTHSACKSTNTPHFLAKRVARIVPAFLIASAVGCLVVGPLTSRDVWSYFEVQSWDSIALSALALKQVGVSGALEGNRLQLVHGTLWTIRYEFDCYLLLALLTASGLMLPGRRIVVFVLLAIGLAAAMVLALPVIDHGLLALVVSSPNQWPALFPFFLAGAAFYLWRDQVPKSPALLAASVAVLALSFALGGVYWAILTAGTYVVLYLSLSLAANIKLFGRRVDLSYGVYLYGWPIQQLLLFYTGQALPPLALFVLALAISYATAWLSWTCVERPCLDLVRRPSAGKQ